MSDALWADLQARLQRLEDLQAIQALKARYLRACDQKQPEIMRDCFVEHGAVIEADGFPTIEGRDGWVQTFTRRSCASLLASTTPIKSKNCACWVCPLKGGLHGASAA